MNFALSCAEIFHATIAGNELQKKGTEFQRQILVAQVFPRAKIYYRTRCTAASKLELGEGLLGASRLGHLQGVVLHGLAQGPAFSNSEGITDGSVSEARGEVDRDVLVPLLKPVVFLDIVKVIPPDDSGPVHLQLGHHTSEDTPTDGHLSGEGTLFVNVVSDASPM